MGLETFWQFKERTLLPLTPLPEFREESLIMTALLMYKFEIIIMKPCPHTILTWVTLSVVPIIFGLLNYIKCKETAKRYE